MKTVGNFMENEISQWIVSTNNCYLIDRNFDGFSRSGLHREFRNFTALARELKVILPLEASILNRDLICRNVPVRRQRLRNSVVDDQGIIEILYTV